MSLLHVLGMFLSVHLLAPAAYAAQSDDDDPFDLDDEDDSDDQKDDDQKPDDTSKPPPIKDDDDLSPVTPEDTIDFKDDEFEEDLQAGERKEGEDDSRIYRDAVERMKRLDPDQEILEWERYLKKYPNSIFKSRIQTRIEELSTSLFDTNLGASSEGGLLDAGAAELRFAQPMLLVPVDPRTRLRVGLEWGFPNWISFQGDYEHQLKRNLSVHGGVQRRYTGTSIEAGARYALIKSARTNTLLTGILDARFNTNPAFGALRPTVAFGQRFNVLSGLDTQVQFGVDLPFGYGDVFQPIYQGGLNVSLAPAEIVRVFAETSTNFKASDVGVFSFNVVTFGIKFVKRKGKNTDLFDGAVGASLPYGSHYWAYHAGAVEANANFYFDE